MNVMMVCVWGFNTLTNGVQGLLPWEKTSNERVEDVVYHSRSLYTYQNNKIMGFGLYKTQRWVPQNMKLFTHSCCEEDILLRLGVPLVGLIYVLMK